EGAEVVVPNGMLLSQNLTNWTLSSKARRVELPVGVADTHTQGADHQRDLLPGKARSSYREHKTQGENGYPDQQHGRTVLAAAMRRGAVPVGILKEIAHHARDHHREPDGHTKDQDATKAERVAAERALCAEPGSQPVIQHIGNIEVLCLKNEPQDNGRHVKQAARAILQRLEVDVRRKAALVLALFQFEEKRLEQDLHKKIQQNGLPEHKDPGKSEDLGQAEAAEKVEHNGRGL
ncbi:MAG: mechanosensitive ion channel, partial [Mucilaginibacter polytrichastri]|nr:mechanosensitive ion channel [Mucilaginibacter polytrichastri]